MAGRRGRNIWAGRTGVFLQGVFDSPLLALLAALLRMFLLIAFSEPYRASTGQRTDVRGTGFDCCM